MLQLKEVKLMRKLTMLSVRNTYNKTITIYDSSIWSLYGKHFDMKDITRV